MLKVLPWLLVQLELFSSCWTSNKCFKSDVDIISYFIYGAMVAMPILIFSDKSLTKIETQRITVIFLLAFFVIFFWGAFEQAGASLTFICR